MQAARGTSGGRRRAGGDLSIAIVGLGPRGLSVLERLLIRLRQEPAAAEVVIWVVDPVEHGSGRIWRTTQPPWLTMNATASEATVRSPDTFLDDRGVAHPYSLSEWTAAPPYAGPAVAPVEYPPRRLYGEYLTDMFRELCADVPPGVHVRPLKGEATSLVRGPGAGLRLRVEDRVIAVDKVVLATGHTPMEPSEEQVALTRFAERHPACTYLGQDIASDMPLDEIPAGATVAVRGLGLTFYDLVNAFSVGRGGEFTRDRTGRLGYRASGREPVVVAGSRGGMPFRGRPRMTQPPETAPHPVVLTDERIASLRAAALTRRGSPKLDFATEVEPLVRAEADLAYYACVARLRSGDAAVERLQADFLATDHFGGGLRGRGGELLARHGLDDVAPLRLDALARPFDDRRFASPGAFRDRLLAVLHEDVVESRKGTAASPMKAALELLRQIRPALPAVVDFGGLLPASHRDFLDRFQPWNYVLSAGPPDDHVERVAALVEAGLVHVVGPAATFEADEGAGRFAVVSPAVGGSRRLAEVLVEARVPTFDLRRTASPLLRQMAADGLVREFVNTDPITGDQLPTGGLALTGSPFHVIDARGVPDPDIHVIGVAADKTRWFTQVGTGRPGQDSPFRRDADAIAADMLDGVAAAATCRVAAAG